MIKISGKSIFQSAKELRQKHDIIVMMAQLHILNYLIPKNGVKIYFKLLIKLQLKENMLTDMM